MKISPKGIYLVLISSVILSCENRNTLCECLDLNQRLSDQRKKSQDEIEEFEEGCEWMSKELSKSEIDKEIQKCGK